MCAKFLVSFLAIAKIALLSSCSHQLNIQRFVDVSVPREIRTGTTATILLKGTSPDGCYRVSSAVANVDEAEMEISISATLTDTRRLLTQSACAMGTTFHDIEVPFTPRKPGIYHLIVPIRVVRGITNVELYKSKSSGVNDNFDVDINANIPIAVID